MIENDVMTITWDRGTMRLNMWACFPCTVGWLRKLLRTTIDKADDPRLYRAELVIYLNELLDNLGDGDIEAALKWYANDHTEHMEMAKKWQEPIDKLTKEVGDRKRWIDVNLGKKQPKHEARLIHKKKKEELAEMKARQRSEKEAASRSKQNFEELVRQKKNLVECLTVLGQEVAAS